MTLLRRLEAIGCSQARMQAMIFGGGRVLKAFTKSRHLGLQNVDVAEEILREVSIRVLHRDTGGTSGRKLLFRTDLGSFAVKVI